MSTRTKLVKRMPQIEKMIRESFQTKNGVRVWIRPLLPQDAPYLVDLFEHMSADSRYRRFRQAVSHSSPERIMAEAERIAHTPLQIGFIAFADLLDQPNAPVGAVRCVCVGEGVAETAVSVRDDMQNQGIGARLLNVLIKEAQTQNVKKLLATIQSTNKAILYILKRIPYAYTQQTIGPDMELELDITTLKSEIGSSALIHSDIE